MVVVAYRRWSFTRGSNCKALAGKRLVFWIGGRLWEAVAYKRWSHVEVQLYFIITGVKKIICYTKDFNYRTSLYQSSTVIGRNLRGGPCKNRPLEFPRKTEFLHFFSAT